MARTNSGAETVIPLLRDDGTVYFEYGPRPMQERICAWALVALWLLMLAVIAITLAWS